MVANRAPTPEERVRFLHGLLMKSKPWMTLVGHVARCNRCGGVSQWVSGVSVITSSGRDRPLDFWRWWKRFKQVHARCPEP